jgi:CHAT domain-containing protein
VADKAAVVYAPSLTAFEALRGGTRSAVSATARPGLLALGNPSPPPGAPFPLPALPQAERQVRALEAFFPPDARHVLVGDAATETAAKREAGDYRLIHIAAHGIVDDASPMYSWLALAPSRSGEDDGRLEAREVINLSLQADLTVLSACETGRGRVSSGEGVIGLSWAFLIAGSANVLVSQWRVDADSTERLVLEFYRAIAAAPASRPADYASALRSAMLKVRQDPCLSAPLLLGRLPSGGQWPRAP